MDRTIMDRTVMENYRAEEKELSDKIHFKIKTLTLINEPTEDFKKIFVKDIFLKPNPKAFFPIMHFLFVTLDPSEFKKRFYWPIIDKKSETNFRSSTVDYLNYLNNKHNLQWSQLKNYLVLMPGGYKFLTFLNSFLDFIVGELVKQREKYLSDKMELQTFDFNFNKLKQQRKCLRMNSMQYCESLENNMKKIKENNNFLYNQFEKISNVTEIPLSVLMDREFLSKFLEFGENLIKEKITSKVDEIVKSEKNIIAIEENIKSHQLHKTEINFDRNELLASFNNIKIYHPNLFGNILCGNNINLEELVKIFEYIIPDIQNLLSSLDPNLLETLKFEENELSKMDSDIIKLDNDITKYSKTLNEELKENHSVNIKKTPMRFKSNTENDLRLKLMNTPPILNLSNSGIDNRDFKMRLPLMNEYYSNDISTIQGSNGTNSGDLFSFANNQTTLMYMKTPKRESKNRNNSTINRSKIMDPTALLRSLTKSKRSRCIGVVANQSNSNLSALAMKWKEQETSFFGSSDKKILEMNENDESLDFNKTIHSKIMETVRKNKITDNSKKLLFESPKKFLKSTVSPKNIAVQQLVNTSLDFSKLSTSPSGRLESLIKMDHSDLPKILLNDFTLELNNSVILKEQVAENGKKTDSPKEKDVENDLNISNFDLKLNLSNSKDLNLSNVSDTILNDIPM